MVERIFDPLALIVILGVGVVGLVVGLILAATRGESWTVALETALLALAGSFLARTFISILLSLGEDSPAAGLLVGWGFFLWPGAIDTVAALFGAQLLTSPDRLLWIAVGVGGLCGLIDGVHRVRSANLAGAATLALDTTWGLGGTTNGCLIHIWNTFAASHQNDGRRNVHRYDGGFRIKSGYAFTQGPVMSELPNGPTTSLYAHERTHVSQNRAFGPFYPLSYLGWMALMLVPGLAAAGVRKAPVGEAVEAWCYYNNPWEAWGYKVGQNNGAGPRTGFGALVWKDQTVLAVAVFYFLAVLAVSAFLISAVWL